MTAVMALLRHSNPTGPQTAGLSKIRTISHPWMAQASCQRTIGLRRPRSTASETTVAAAKPASASTQLRLRSFKGHALDYET